jgi:hypothetical protein
MLEVFGMVSSLVEVLSLPGFRWFTDWRAGFAGTVRGRRNAPATV